MSETRAAVVDVSAEHVPGLDDFKSEAELVSAIGRPAPRPLMQHPSLRRTNRGHHRRVTLEWGVSASVFGCGLVIGALLTRPAETAATPERAVAPVAVATVRQLPAPATTVAVVRDESGTSASSAAPVAPAVEPVVLPTRIDPPSPRRARVQAPGYRGTLIVTSTPRGASVFLNNRLAGQTPLVMRGVRSGSRAVRVDLDGYSRWSRGISVVANESTTISARLVRTD